MKTKLNGLILLISLGFLFSFSYVRAEMVPDKFCDTNSNSSDGIFCAYPKTWSNTGNANINARCATESVVKAVGCPANTASSTYAFSCVNNNCTMTCVGPTYQYCSDTGTCRTQAAQPNANCTSWNWCTGVCSACNNTTSCTFPSTWSNTSCSCVAGTVYTIKLGADSTANGNTGTNLLQSGAQAALFIKSFDIGIGTSTPITKLHLYDASSGPVISLSGLTTNYRGISVRNTVNSEQMFYGLNNVSNFVLRASGATDLITASTTAFALAINSLPTTGFLINKAVNINGVDSLFTLGYLAGQGTKFLTVGNDGAVSYNSLLNTNGTQLAIGTSTFSGLLNINGGTNMSGNLNIIGDLVVSNKLTVKTIDPLYDIFGTKYSTFAPSVVGGVKEEIAGKININKKIGEEYQAIINFDKQAVGSDLWVWRQVIDFNKENVEVSLTPYGKFARTYYYISGNSIVLRADLPVEVSYNFSGRRFDWRDWPTKAHNQSEKPSLIIR